MNVFRKTLLSLCSWWVYTLTLGSENTVLFWKTLAFTQCFSPSIRPSQELKTELGELDGSPTVLPAPKEELAEQGEPEVVKPKKEEIESDPLWDAIERCDPESQGWKLWSRESLQRWNNYGNDELPQPDSDLDPNDIPASRQLQLVILLPDVLQLSQGLDLFLSFPG